MLITTLEILKSELVGKTLMTAARHVYILEIVDIDRKHCYEGQVNLILENGTRVEVYPDEQIEVA